MKLSGDIARKYSKVAGNKIDELGAQKKVLAEMNDVFMSGKGNGKLLNENSFQLVDEIGRDAITGFRFRSGLGLLKDRPVGSPLPKEVVKWNTETGQAMINPKTGKEIMESVKVIDPATGKPKQLYNVALNEMDPKKVEAFRKKLINEYKADPKEVTNLFDTFTKGRDTLGEMFTSMGRRIRPDMVADFEAGLRENINNVVDRGYNVFKNNRGQKTVAGNYPPTKDILRETFDFYKKASIEKGYKLSDEFLERMVQDSWEHATLAKGFVLGSKIKPGQVKLKGFPEFLTKSVKNDLTDPTFAARTNTNLAEVTGVAKPIIKKLLGKADSPINTLVEGVTNLSAQVRSGEAFDQMMRKSNELKVGYDDWLKKVKLEGREAAGKEPPLPFLFDDAGEAHKYVRGGEGDVAQIGGKEGYCR